METAVCIKSAFVRCTFPAAILHRNLHTFVPSCCSLGTKFLFILKKICLISRRHEQSNITFTHFNVINAAYNEKRVPSYERSGVNKCQEQ